LQKENKLKIQKEKKNSKVIPHKKIIEKEEKPPKDPKKSQNIEVFCKNIYFFFN